MVKRYLSIPALLLTLLAATCVGPLVQPGHASDVSARQILDHLYMSNGQPIEDMMIEAEFSRLKSGDSSGNLRLASRDKLFFKRPNKLRDDATLVEPGTLLDGTTRTVIRDGSNVWMFVSLSPRPLKHMADTPTESILLPYFLQRYPEDADKDYILVGRQAVDGVPCEVVRVSNPDTPQDVTTIWVDTHRWVPLKTEHSVPGKHSHQPTVKSVIYRDIRQTADGRWFPLHLEIYQDDVLNTLAVYTALSINTGLQDDLFAPMEKFMRSRMP